MKWRNHALMAASVGLIMDLPPWEIGYCVLGANLPDQMEKIGRFRILGHRKWTHEVLVWLVPMLFFLLIPALSSGVPNTSSSGEGLALAYLFTIRSWVLFLPGLVHLAGDLFTPRGIQAAGGRISMRLFETGHPLEYLVAGLFAALAIAHRVGWKHIFPGAQ